MCRIAGIVDRNKKQHQIQAEVKLMCDAMAHGGPDDEGYYFDEAHQLGFGHRRLSLLDLSNAGHQPMQYDDGNLVISYNGEIYNYLELAEALKLLGYQFNSSTDTEVILASYEAWGLASFAKLKGMFAFALFDKRRNVTHLVRDKNGIKPLYYSTINQSLTFASEVKPFKYLSHAFKENPDWQTYFLAFGHIPEPFTTYTDISVLPKGHYLTWHHKNNQFELTSFDTRRYHAIENQAQIADYSQASEEIHKRLKDAVARHLLSDAPIGVFLSGGLDSSIISLLTNEIQNEKKSKQTLNTVSLNFDAEGFSEREYQEAVVSKTNGQHGDFTIDRTLFSTLFPQAIAGMDQPTTDGINTYFVSFFAKKMGLKAVLSGIGADELFGGYPSFRRMKFVALLSKVPKQILRLGRHFSKSLLKRAYYLSYQNHIGEYLFLRGIYGPTEISELLNIPLKKVDETLNQVKLAIPIHFSQKEKAGWMEQNVYMQNQLLKDTDTMSMQHGVEVRVPFLDDDFISLVGQINPKIKFGNKRPKSLLIHAFRAMVPEKIWKRPKMGFTFPFQHWLQEEPCFQNLALNNTKAKQLIDDFSKNKIHWSKALAIYQVYKRNPLS
ncbi:asparagine synthase (glutamine-hydrolyzing) [Pedobacter sandarakinus]|uniref:asparagine synthase (glutamine-hydrolyzing) n=1 Tax=Pedobacter sandarakinus TaxID=353156 RepID=UPI002245F77E|nr:asparagine synthase (glutamine-hydrolyzing) [Pedobacter sandarakinus]MCX2575938.1 asparagine synthase (glutamine-hydrolyzing) [Pedobacter sandarakinus]